MPILHCIGIFYWSTWSKVPSLVLVTYTLMVCPTLILNKGVARLDNRAKSGFILTAVIFFFGQDIANIWEGLGPARLAIGYAIDP